MIYLLLFFCSCIFTFGIKKYAIYKKFLDVPNMRSSHKVPTPHGGGIAIALCWFAGIFYLFMAGTMEASLFYSLLAGILLCVVSLADDIYEVKPKYRLIAQSVTAFLGLLCMGGLKSLDFGIITFENFFIVNCFAFLMIVWFVNLYNFLDGIDGYAASEAIFLSIGGYIFFQDKMFLVLIASCAGFLIFNWHKAKIFMGDVGSTLLGYNVAIFAIYYQSSGHSILIWFILFGVFLFDASWTLFRRFKNKEVLHVAHKKHAYQRMHQYGWTHDKIVLWAMGCNGVLFFIAFFAFNIGFIAFIGAFLFLFLVIKFVDKKRSFV